MSNLASPRGSLASKPQHIHKLYFFGRISLKKGSVCNSIVVFFAFLLVPSSLFVEGWRQGTVGLVSLRARAPWPLAVGRPRGLDRGRWRHSSGSSHKGHKACPLKIPAKRTSRGFCNLNQPFTKRAINQTELAVDCVCSPPAR